MKPEQLSCLAERLHDTPEDVVDVIVTFDWKRSGQRLLDELRRAPVPGEDWHMIAQLVERRQPRAALALLELASSSQNVDLQVESRVAQLRLAKWLGDGVVVDHARAEIEALAMRASVKLRLVNQLASLDEQPLVAKICDGGRDAAITWACAEADRGHLDGYLAAIANLPVLDHTDAERLLRLRDRDRLPILRGLDCLGRGMESQEPRADGHENGGYEVIIYYRLRSYSRERCLLKQARDLCLRQILKRHPCLLPFVFSDVDAAIQEGVNGVLNSETYNFLVAAYTFGNVEAAEALLHLHLALAEAVNYHWRKAGADRPDFHVAQAFRLWVELPRTESFRSMLSESLRKLVCDDVAPDYPRRARPRKHGGDSACVRMCGHDRRSTCLQTCKPTVPKLIEACNS